MARLTTALSRLFTGPSGAIFWLMLSLLVVLTLLPRFQIFASTAPYLGFHSLTEILCVIVAVLAALAVFNGYKQLSSRLTAVGCLFLLSAGFDTLHLLTMPGMPELFTPNTLNKAIHFWLLARLSAITGLLLLAPASKPSAKRPTGRRIILLFSALFLIGAATGMAQPGWLPRLYDSTTGLTSVKIASEWLLAIMAVIAGLLLLRNNRIGQRQDREMLTVAAWITAMAEICFTLYGTANDEFNVIGHLYKAVSYVLIFRALFLTHLRLPWQSMARAQQALTHQEQRWQLALTGSETGVWDFDLSEDRLFCSSQFHHNLGYRDGELPRRTEHWRQRMIHPEDQAHVRETLQAHLSGHAEYWHCEARVRDAHGHWCWLRINGQIMARDASGQPTRLVGTALDIQPIREREQELSHVRSRLQAIFDTAPMGLMVFNSQGELQQHNGALRRLLDNRQDEHPAPHGIWQWINHERRAEVKRHWQQWRQATTDEYTPFREQIALADRQAEERWTRWLVTPLPEGDYLGVIEDISDQRRAMSLLRENAELYRSTFESGNAIKLLVDPESDRIEDANPAAVEYYGYSLAELRQMKLSELVQTPLTDIRARIERSLESGSSHFESRHLGRDGRVREVEVFTASIVRDGRQLIYEMVHDISARKHAENKLHQLNQRLARYGENRRHLNQLGTRLYTLTELSELPHLLEQELPNCFPEVCGVLALRFEELEEDAHRVRWGTQGCEQHTFHHEERLETAAGTIGKLTLRGTPEDEEDRERLERMASDAARAVTLSVINLRLRQQLTRHAYRDALTGLYNRRHLETELPSLLSRATPDQPLSLVLLDLDHFKQLNDTWGHDIGDEVLRAIARIMEGMLRSSDIACRYGGEEFVVVMPGASANIAERRLGMILDRFRNWRLTLEEGVIEQRSFSAGLIEAPRQGQEMTQLLEQADRALYMAKRAGRARIVAATESS
ncbi:MASE3 domain-containing protein [Kushneria phosphatilytica]|uniref:Diguanylate cyclase n=1 Tax=Kushneria phosphatilytica TaxID=657387 RepID=A0A1S1NV77_9GAMM|nr:MASE3 domain-containing protein [Kushneria phosphatilytica]OHV07667.1 hypothetical protein BH688_15840 [Kushneria phosphatilytica]QEL10162.1 diguanylate cyclase [Kushneria phosphatilytica]